MTLNSYYYNKVEGKRTMLTANLGLIAMAGEDNRNDSPGA